MFDKLCRFVQFSVILAPFTVAVAEFSLDYYFDDNLRTNLLLDCSSEVLKQSCLMKCGPHHACLLGKCLCIQKEQEERSDEDSEEIEKSSDQEVMFNDVEDYTEMTLKMPPQVPMAGYEPKPTLRHHIAHFCPNLDVARDCIRKCVKLGKPAFCGKDHVCYCGHKYDNPNNDDKKVNAADPYAEFKDMYEKYFGPRVTTSSANAALTTTAASESFEDR